MAPKKRLKLNIRERSLKAFLDIAILCVLCDKPLSGYELSVIFVRKHKILISTSMIYYKLYSMERKGRIRCLQERPGRVYGLTEQGQAIVANRNDILEENKYCMQSIFAPAKFEEQSTK